MRFAYFHNLLSGPAVLKDTDAATTLNPKRSSEAGSHTEIDSSSSDELEQCRLQGKRLKVVIDPEEIPVEIIEISDTECMKHINGSAPTGFPTHASWKENVSENIVKSGNVIPTAPWNGTGAQKDDPFDISEEDSSISDSQP